MRDTIELARMAGFQTGKRDYADGNGAYPFVVSVATGNFLVELKAFEALVRADERAASVQEPVALDGQRHLVEILAENWRVWPAQKAVEQTCLGDVYCSTKGRDLMFGNHEIAVDQDSAVVTKEMWSTMRQTLAAQPAPVQPADGTQVSKVWWDGEKLMAKPIPLEDFYQPVQEPVARIEINYRHGELESWRFAEKPVNAPAGIYDVYAIAAPDITYSIDADPSGIRKRAADAIIGALTLGAQDSPPPPEGHWLQQFWNIGRAEASKATPPAAQPAPTVQEPVKPTAQEVQNAAANLSLMREMWGDPNQPAAKVNAEGFIVETGLLLSPGTLLYTTPPAQPAPVEPVACVACEGNPKWGNIPCAVCGTTQPAAQRQWVGLTDDERLEVAEIDGADEWFWKVCKAIEAKLKEKNT